MADQYVKHDQDDYTEVLSELRPQGAAWPRDPESTQMKVINGLAGPWGNEISDAADEFLVTESFPPTSIELLSDWETSFGLPDKCLKIPTTIDARHAAIVHRMTLQGGPSRAFFINEALYQGYSISIQEYSPYMCGVSYVGPTGELLNPDDPTSPHWTLGPAQNRYYWTVHVPSIKDSDLIAPAAVAAVSTSGDNYLLYGQLVLNDYNGPVSVSAYLAANLTCVAATDAHIGYEVTHSAAMNVTVLADNYMLYNNIALQDMNGVVSIAAYQAQGLSVVGAVPTGDDTLVLFYDSITNSYNIWLVNIFGHIINPYYAINQQLSDVALSSIGLVAFAQYLVMFYNSIGNYYNVWTVDPLGNVINETYATNQVLTNPSVLATPLIHFGIECLFNRYKPAHTIVIFDYTPQDNVLTASSLATKTISLGQPTIH